MTKLSPHRGGTVSYQLLVLVKDTGYWENYPCLDIPAVVLNRRWGPVPVTTFQYFLHGLRNHEQCGIDQSYNSASLLRIAEEVDE